MFTGVGLFAYWGVRKLAIDDQGGGGFWRWVRRGSVSVRVTWAPGSAPEALVQGLPLESWGQASASATRRVLPVCTVCTAGVLQRACPFPCGRATSPVVLCAAAIRILRWVQGQPPAAGFCPAVAEKKPAHTGSTWPGRLGVGQGCRDLHPWEARWLMVSWFPSRASFLWWHESLWVGGGHPVPLRPGASPWAPEGGWGAGDSAPVTPGEAPLRRGCQERQERGWEAPAPAHPVLPGPVCLTAFLL